MFEVVGGPCDGRRVSEVVVTEQGYWIMDRTWLCRPSVDRGAPRNYYPYELLDGRYVWRGDDETT